ncbi:hypothetical protein EC988_005080, partial [Linderina pennispora]
MSQSELEHMDLLKQEDDARNEQLQQMRTHFRTYTTPSKPDYDPSNQHANQGGLKQTVAAASGGFHTVSLPLSQSAKDALNNLVSDSSIAVVELQVEGGKSITAARTYQSADSFSPCTAEPRFYVMNSQPHRVFIYSCPEGCAPRLRMVYSTATQRTLAQIQELGCQLTHKLSVFSSKECTPAAVAAAVRSGQAQRASSEKAVDVVVNYVPNKPAQSLPSRFAAGTTRSLDAFTDEAGFRKAFSDVRPDAPAPAPFKTPSPAQSFKTLSPAQSFNTPSPSQSFRSAVSSQSQNDGVDSSPNTGAAAWGVQLKSGSRNGSPRPPVRGSAGVSPKQTPPPRSPKPETEVMHSSLPGLRHVSKGDQVSKGNQVSTSEKQWDPWRPVSTVDDSVKSTAPESSLQSAVFTKEASTKESIPSLMGDITDSGFEQHVSLELVQKLTRFLASGAPGSDAADLGRVRLSDLGLAPELGSDMELDDLTDRFKIRLSDKYMFDLSKHARDEVAILSIPFADVFELPPRSIKYVSMMLELFAQAGAENAKRIASVVGLENAELGQPANTASVASL